MNEQQTDIQIQATAPLSVQGIARRDAMLPVLQRAVHRRGVRRRVARTALAMVPLIAIAIGVVLYMGRGSAPPPRSLAADDASGFSGANSSAPGSDSDLSGSAELASGQDSTPTRALPPVAEAPAALAAAPLLTPDQIAAWTVIPRVTQPAPSVIRRATADTSLIRRTPIPPAPMIARASDDDLAGALRASGVRAGVVRTPAGVSIIEDRPPPADASKPT